MEFLVDWWSSHTYWGSELLLGTNKFKFCSWEFMPIFYWTNRREWKVGKTGMEFSDSFPVFLLIKNVFLWLFHPWLYTQTLQKGKLLCQARLFPTWWISPFYSAASEDCSDCKNKALGSAEQNHCLQMKRLQDLPFLRHFAAKVSWFVLRDERIFLSDCTLQRKPFSPQTPLYLLLRFNSSTWFCSLNKTSVFSWNLWYFKY